MSGKRPRKGQDLDICNLVAISEKQFNFAVKKRIGNLVNHANSISYFIDMKKASFLMWRGFMMGCQNAGYFGTESCTVCRHLIVFSWVLFLDPPMST